MSISDELRHLAAIHDERGWAANAELLLRAADELEAYSSRASKNESKIFEFSAGKVDEYKAEVARLREELKFLKIDHNILREQLETL